MKKVILSTMVGDTGVRVMDETLTDGSHVYSVELGSHVPRVVCEIACAGYTYATETYQLFTGQRVTSIEISEGC